MNVARFDFSWGSMAYHTKTLANLREAMKQTKILCATMVDTRGSEIGVQLAPEDVTSFDAAAPKSQLVLEQGSRVTLTTDLSVAPSAAFLPVNNPDLVNFVSPGDDVFVGQYLFTGSEGSSVFLKVDEVDVRCGSVHCTCKNSAKLSGVLLTVQVSNKGDDLPCLSAWDDACIVVVTGNVSAKGLIIDSETHFHVLGETVIDGPLVGNLGESAYCRFVGRCRAQALVQGEDGELEFVWNDASDEDVSDDTGDEVDAETYPDIAATVDRLGSANWRT